MRSKQSPLLLERVDRAQPGTGVEGTPISTERVLIKGNVCFPLIQHTPTKRFKGPLHTRRCGGTLSKQERAGAYGSISCSARISSMISNRPLKKSRLLCSRSWNLVSSELKKRWK